MTDRNDQEKAKTQVEGLSLIAERTYDAPRELVWRAWTEPEHVARWWGYQGVKLALCEIDLREGGGYRYVQRTPDGYEVPFKGVYREVVKPERLVYTQIFDVEPYSAHESIVTDTFAEETGGRTRLTTRTEFASEEALQGALASGAEEGAAASLERFAEHLRTYAVGAQANN